MKRENSRRGRPFPASKDLCLRETLAGFAGDPVAVDGRSDTCAASKPFLCPHRHQRQQQQQQLFGWRCRWQGECRYRACLPWHSRLEHCAGFHQSPLWQWQMLQSSTFTSMPAGIIVVPAKQLGPEETQGSNRGQCCFVSKRSAAALP